MIRLLFFVGLGLLAGAGVVLLVGPPGAGVWAVAIGPLVTIMSAVLIGVGRETRSLQLPDPRMIEAARQQDRLALARIDALRQTGTTINEQPVCDIELTVVPRYGSAYRSTVRTLVGLTDIPRFQPGRRRVVAILADGQPDVVITDDDPAGPTWHGMTVPSPESAGPLRKPAPGTLRPDGSRRRPIISTNPSTRPLRIVLFLLASVITAAAVVYPYRVAASQTLSVLPDGRIHADARSPEVLPEAIATLEREIGHDRLVDVVATRDFVTVDAPVTAGKKATDAWTYRRGKVEHEGAAVIQPDSAHEQFTATEVDWEKLWPAVERAAGRTMITDLDEVSLGVSRDPNGDPDSDAPGTLAVRFSIDNNYDSIFFRMKPDGTGLQRT